MKQTTCTCNTGICKLINSINADSPSLNISKGMGHVTHVTLGHNNVTSPHKFDFTAVCDVMHSMHGTSDHS